MILGHQRTRLSRVPEVVMGPDLVQKEDDQAGLAQFLALVAFFELVLRNYGPFTFRRKRSNPGFVRCVVGKYLIEVNNGMAAVCRECMQCLGQRRREIVVDEELHAASCSSKAIAASTAATGTS